MAEEGQGHEDLSAGDEPASTFSEFPDFGGPIQQCVLSLVAKVDDEVFPVGTGFVINPDGLFITASHVLVGAASRGRRRRAAGEGYYGHYEFFAIYLQNEPNPDGTLLGGPLPIDHVWAPEDLDIGFGWLRLPVNRATGERLPLAALPIRPAMVADGAPIVGLGYHRMEEGTQLDDIGRLVVEISQHTAVSRGRVNHVYPISHDAVLRPFPCFETDARFDPGMSGGPILTPEGKVCGVICSGVDDGAEDAYFSTGSLIWPIFGCEIEVARDGSSTPLPVLLYDLAREGLIPVDETFSHVSVERLPSGHRRVEIRAPGGHVSPRVPLE